LLDALNKDNATSRTNSQRAVSYNDIGGQDYV